MKNKSSKKTSNSHQTNNKLKQCLPYYINSLIIVIIFCLILAISHSYPFDTKLTIGKVDAIAQYKPMLYNFIMHLKTHTLELFSFNNGLGNSLLFNLSYYLLSPLNLIAIFFNNHNMMYFSVILTKIIATCLTTTFYAKKKGCSNFNSLIVTLSYVFSSWFVVYYYNIMWLDTFLIMPLVQYGLEELITKKKYLLFILSLSYAYVTNFYLAFSLIVYSIVYFIIRNFFYEQSNPKEKIKTGLLYLFSLLSCILVLALFFNILVTVKHQMGLGFSNVEDASYNLGTIDFFKSLFYGNTILTIDFSGHTFPNIAVNTIIFLSTIFFFINSKISTRDKLFSFIGLVLIIMCMFIPKLDYIMHFFHNVVGLTYRYTFIFIFLSITMFIKNINNFNKEDLKKMTIPITVSLIIVLLLFLFKQIALYVLLLNVVPLFLSLILIFTYKDNKIVKSLILLIVIIQSFVVGYKNIPSTEQYSQDLFSSSFIREPIKYRLNTIDENDFLNKNMYTNQEVTYLFTSMTYNEVLKLVSYLGVASNSNVIINNSYNDLYSLLFNVKNELYLEKIYACNKDIKNIVFSDYDIKYNTEEVIKKMSGITDIYKEISIPPKVEGDTYYYNVNYHYFLLKDNENIFPMEGNFTIDKDKTTTKNATIYILKPEKLKEIYDYLSQNQISYTHYQDTKIEGIINVPENEMIFTSIPYDESWNIFVDGKPTKPIKVLDSLIGIEVEPGKHEIVMEYKNDFTKSTVISIISLIILLSINLYSKFKKNKKIIK